ncbi:MAG: hypothetical protein PVSMB8_09350 [Vulcanimicrobiaceae bacterium]
MYDLGFSYRDIRAECDGLLAIARRHGVESPKRVVDVACGPAHHLRELARRGAHGYGVDLNRAMVQYARRLAKADGVSVALSRGDMRTFRAPKRCDIAMCLFDAFAHCLTEADGIATLRAAAGSLRRGGLFVVELTHPADYFRVGSRRTMERWSRRMPEAVIKTAYAMTRIDPTTETYVASMTIDATYRGRRKPQRLVDRQLHRMWLRSGIESIAARSGSFRPVGWYGDLSPQVPFGTSKQAWRMVSVLKRM